jgi:hypothetical protein
MNKDLIDRLQILTGKVKMMTANDMGEKKEFIIEKVCEYLGETFSIETLEAILKIYKGRLKEMTDKEMPEIMMELGVPEIVLPTGERLKNEKIINATIKDKYAAWEWIKKIGREDVVKTVLKFGKGEVDDVLIKMLSSNGYSYEKDDTVHHQTLNKMIREMYKAGEKLPPPNAIEAIPFDRVKIIN